MLFKNPTAAYADIPDTAYTTTITRRPTVFERISDVPVGHPNAIVKDENQYLKVRKFKADNDLVSVSVEPYVEDGAEREIISMNEPVHFDHITVSNKPRKKDITRKQFMERLKAKPATPAQQKAYEQRELTRGAYSYQDHIDMVRKRKAMRNPFGGPITSGKMRWSTGKEHALKPIEVDAVEIKKSSIFDEF